MRPSSYTVLGPKGAHNTRRPAVSNRANAPFRGPCLIMHNSNTLRCLYGCDSGAPCPWRPVLHASYIVRPTPLRRWVNAMRKTLNLKVHRRPSPLP